MNPSFWFDETWDGPLKKHVPAYGVAGFICFKNIAFLSEDKRFPLHEISNNVVYATSKGADQPAHTRRLIIAVASR